MGKVEGVPFEKQIENLKGVTVLVLSDNKQVGVRVCRTKHIPILLGLLRRVVEPMQLKFSKTASMKQGEFLGLLDDVGFAMTLLEDSFPQVVEAVEALTVGLSKEEIEELDPADTIIILKDIVRINYDFFTQRLAPLFAGVFKESPQTTTSQTQ